jgi:predicted PurR-regulated permease PerM
MNNTSHLQIQKTLQLLFLGLLIWGTCWIMLPFLLALIWATIIVVATWPLLLRLQARLGNNRKLALAIMIPASLLCLIGPIILAVVMIVIHSSEIAGGAKSLVSMAAEPPPGWVERIPMIGPKIAGEWQKLATDGPEELTSRILPFVDNIIAWFASKAGSLGMLIVQLALTSLIAAILYSNGEKAAKGVHRFARRLGGARGDDSLLLAVQTVRGVALGVIGTAVIQAVFAGIGLVIAGVPNAGILTAIMVLLGIVQIGAVPVLVPAVIWLYWTGHPGMGTFLLVWTVITVTMDNFVRPMLIRTGVDLPFLLIVPGVIGGLIAFGATGLFLGPVVLAVSYTLLVAWIKSDDPEAELERQPTAASLPLL